MMPNGGQGCLHFMLGNHAVAEGAIINRNRGRVEGKIKALEDANVNIVKEPRAIPAILKKMI